jgi:hypothetical protein
MRVQAASFRRNPGGFLGPEMVHPRYRILAGDEKLPDSLTPVYPTTAGLSQASLRRLIARALQTAPTSTELLDLDWCKRHSLLPFGTAVTLLHAPPPEASEAALQTRSHPAWRRIKFDELLAQQLSLRRAYLARRQQGCAGAGRRRPARPPFRGLAALCADRRAAARRGRDCRRPGRALPDAASAAGRCRLWQDHRRGTGGLSGHRGGLSGGLHGADRNPRRTAFPEAARLARTARGRSPLAGGQSQEEHQAGQAVTGRDDRATGRRNACADSGEQSISPVSASPS